MKKIVIICTYLLIFSFIVLSCTDIKHTYYYNLKDLTEDQKSWIPDILYNDEAIRETVINISENHDLDTNEIWGSFQTNYEFSDNLKIYDLDSFSLNHNKIKKRLASINYSPSNIYFGVYFITKTFNYIFYYDSEKNMYFYYGVYK